MLNTLIKGSLIANDISYLEKFPRLFLSPKEIEFLDWLTTYNQEYKTLPNVERVEDTDYSIYLSDHMITSPLADLYTMAFDAKREQFALKNFRDIQLQIDSGDMPTEKIIDLGFKLSQAADNNTIYLGDFNRDELYSDETPLGIKFGFDLIDEQTGGLQAGEFGIITARPETGKTWLTNFISWNVATDYGFYLNCKRVLYISAEMTPARIATRMDAIAGGFNTKLLRTKSDKTALKEAKKRASDAWDKIHKHGGDVIIPKLGIITPQAVLNLINTHKPDLVICDAIYRFNSTSGSNDWRSDSETIRSIANIARMTNTPILATTQLKRDSVTGQYRLEDIAMSDSYAQEASIVLAAWNLPSSPASIIIATLKARDGSKYGDVEIKISFNTSSYSEHEAVNQDEY